MTTLEIEEWVWTAIRKTVNKFREQPDYFFTESDIASYLWMCLYTKHLEVEAHGRKLYCVHREYPTNFRYSKPELLDTVTPAPLADLVGSRGNYDLVIIDPEFVRTAPGLAHVVNKNVRRLEERFDASASELLFAIELKYIISGSKAWVKEIDLDNRKLLFAKSHNVQHAINLVFCSVGGASVSSFREAVKRADDSTLSVLIQSYYKDDAKQTVKPVWNDGYTGAGIARLGWKPETHMQPYPLSSSPE